MAADSQVRMAGTAAVLGLAVVVGFFLPFIDVGGLLTVSGWEMLVAEQTPLDARIALGALPIFGLGMLGSGLLKARCSRRLCLLFGLIVLLYLLYKLVKLFLATTGLGLWITLGAAVVALGVALVTKK